MDPRFFLGGTGLITFPLCHPINVEISDDHDIAHVMASDSNQHVEVSNPIGGTPKIIHFRWDFP